jgi:hypothetical protein
MRSPVKLVAAKGEETTSSADGMAAHADFWTGHVGLTRGLDPPEWMVY